MNINKTKRKELTKAWPLAIVRAIYFLTSFSAGTYYRQKSLCIYGTSSTIIADKILFIYSARAHVTTPFGDISKAELLKVPFT